MLMMDRIKDRRRTRRLIAPLALILRQHLRLVFGAEPPIPVRELYRSARQSLFDINFPASYPNKTTGISHSLRIPLPEGALQICRGDLLALRIAENGKW